MAKKYFLGSVGKAEAFRRNKNNELELAFVSKTLTDSGLNISTTKDDIRGGTGAPIQFSFFHDPSVEITLTDIVFNRKYIEAQLGANFSDAGNADNVDYVIATKVADANGQAELDEIVKPLPFACDVEDKYLVWGSIAGADEYNIMTLAPDHKTVTGLNPNQTYCFRYLAFSNKSRMAEITSTIIPEELFLIITAPIFAGDACAASRGKEAGHIVFEVPRFQLNGAQEFAMNMSSNQTMSLAGTALASDSIACDSMGGKLLRIIEVLGDTDYKQDVVSLMVDSESAEGGDTPSVYGELRDGHFIKIDNSDLTFTPELVDGKFVDKTIYNIVLTGTSVGTTAYVGDPAVVRLTLSNVTITPDDTEVELYYGEEYSFKVAAADNYHLPEQITVVGTDTFSYDNTTGDVSVTGKLNDITITISGVAD